MSIKTTFFSALFLCMAYTGLAQEAQIETITIESKALNQTREILVYKPMNYDFGQMTRFNVIYVFDAHDRVLFDYAASVSHLLKEGHQGFILVGIKATWIEELEYGRNHDLLPSGTTFDLGPADGNAENFLSYVKDEVVPFVEANYRTLPRRLAVGHSLSASFVVYSLLNATDVFDNYIAISPNLSYDDHYLVKGLKAFDTGQIKTPKYLYLSHANEAVDTNFWRGWKAAIEEAHPFLKNELPTEQFDVVSEIYPDKMHREGFVPALQSAMSYYLNTVEAKQDKILSEEQYEITVKVTVPNPEDEIYITGNQESLADWAPDKIKMKRSSSLEREITLKVQDPVMAKFTRGNWDSEAWIEIEGGQANFPLTIRPKSGKTYTAKIVTYTDRF